MGKSETCVDCGTLSPKTDSTYTLMGAEYGWRVTRAKKPNGVQLDWRCPACWSAYKKSRPEVSTALAAPPRSRAGRQSFRDPTAKPRTSRPPTSTKRPRA